MVTIIDEDKNKAGSSYINSDFIFTTEIGNYINSSNFRKSYKRILEGADITFKKLHSLRHTYATKLFEKNEHIKTVSELLGHSDISITANIYTHVTPETKSFAAEKLNHLFEWQWEYCGNK